MAPAPAPAPASAPGDQADPLDETEHTDTVVSAVAICPNPECRFPVAPGDRYCEECGHDVTQPFVDGPGAGGAENTGCVIVVSADRALWQRLAPEGVPFPDGCAPRTIPLGGDAVLIGRADRERGMVPDVDLGELPGDPGVSRRHAQLSRDANGAWTVTDLGSANGTWCNDESEPLTPGIPVSIAPGDRVQLGAFTVLELRRA
jgi:hypothetical protein